MNRRDVFLAALLSLILVGLLIPFAQLGVDMHHDGIMLKPALDVLSGQVLFRDTFMQYGALTCYIQAAALWLKPTLLCLKIVTAVAYGATLFVLYAAWRLILPRSLTVMAALGFVLFIPGYEKNVLGSYWVLLPWSSVLAMLFQSIGLYALFQVIRGVNSGRWAWVLGLTCAAVFWCRQPVGLIMFGCLAVIWVGLLWTNWQSGAYAKRSLLVGFCGGALIVSAPILVRIVASGAESAWWYQNFLWPRKWAEAGMEGNWSWGHIALQMVFPMAGVQLLVLLAAVIFPTVWGKFRPRLPYSFFAVYYVFLAGILAWQHRWLVETLDLRRGGWTTLLPVVILVQTLICFGGVLRDRGSFKSVEHYMVAAWSVFSLGSVLQYFPVPDAWHIMWSIAPGFGLLIFVFRRWIGWGPAAMAIAVLAAFLPSMVSRVGLARQLMAQPWVTLEAPSVLRGSRVHPEQAWMIGRIVETVKQAELARPGIPSAMMGNDALYLCFTKNLANPTPYFVTWKALAPAGDKEKRQDYMSRVRPLMFMISQNPTEMADFLRAAHYVPILHLAGEGLLIGAPAELSR
ncbi:MAG: hypothetical protein ABI273_18700 [Lacunisphaera sp.]